MRVFCVRKALRRIHIWGLSFFLRLLFCSRFETGAREIQSRLDTGRPRREAGPCYWTRRRDPQDGPDS